MRRMRGRHDISLKFKVSPNGSVQLGVMKVNCHYKSQQQMLFVGIFEARGLQPRGEVRE